MYFKEITIDEYAEFWKTSECRNFLNSPEAMLLRKNAGTRVNFVAVEVEETVVCASPLVFLPTIRLFKYCYIQRGLLIDYKDETLLKFFLNNIKKYAKKQGAIYIMTDPYVLHRQRDISGNLVDGGFDNSHVVKNLKANGSIYKGDQRTLDPYSQIRWMFSLYFGNRNEKELLSSFSELTKRSINKADKFGVKIKELTTAEVGDFCEMIQLTADRRNFESRTEHFYTSFMKSYGNHCKVLLAYIDIDEYREYLFRQSKIAELAWTKAREKAKSKPESVKLANKEKSALVILDKNKKLISEVDALRVKCGKILKLASAIFTVYDNEVVYVWGGMRENLKHFGGAYALQWHMIKYCIENKIDRYNFYGISGDLTENAADYGVYKFKKGFGGVVEELVGEFELPVSKVLYKIRNFILRLKSK